MRLDLVVRDEMLITTVAYIELDEKNSTVEIKTPPHVYSNLSQLELNCLNRLSMALVKMLENLASEVEED